MERSCDAADGPPAYNPQHSIFQSTPQELNQINKLIWFPSLLDWMKEWNCCGREVNFSSAILYQ